MHHHKNERLSNKGILKGKEIDKFTLDVLKKYDIRYGSLDQKAGQLFRRKHTKVNRRKGTGTEFKIFNCSRTD